MAKVLNKISKSDVEDIFVTDVGTVVLELSGQEALTLMALVRAVGGDKDTTARVYSDEIHRALRQIDSLCNEYDSGIDALDFQGSISFEI